LGSCLVTDFGVNSTGNFGFCYQGVNEFVKVKEVAYTMGWKCDWNWENKINEHNFQKLRLGKLRKWKDNIKMNHKETDCEDVS
jgi:hypothetical protein